MASECHEVRPYLNDDPNFSILWCTIIFICCSVASHVLYNSFTGQAGRGNNEEFGLLSLEYDENFCMGGPGVIMSRETLRLGNLLSKFCNLHSQFFFIVAPHIPTCLKNLYSTHEDVEVGRCVQKFARIPCTWNYEVSMRKPCNQIISIYTRFS